MKALGGISDVGDTTLQYYERAATVFLERFRCIWDEHMARRRKWLSNDTHYYICGGEWCRWIIHYHDNIQGQEEDNDGLDDVFEFKDIEVDLSDYHRMTHGRVLVN